MFYVPNTFILVDRLQIETLLIPLEYLSTFSLNLCYFELYIVLIELKVIQKQSFYLQDSRGSGKVDSRGSGKVWIHSILSKFHLICCCCLKLYSFYCDTYIVHHRHVYQMMFHKCSES